MEIKGKNIDKTLPGALYLWRAHVSSFPQMSVHSWSTSMQQSWLHLCRPQDRFFWQRFSHLLQIQLLVRNNAELAKKNQFLPKSPWFLVLHYSF